MSRVIKVIKRNSLYLVIEYEDREWGLTDQTDG